MGQIGIPKSPLSTLARGRMGGNTYFQYDCVIYVFILGLMIFHESLLSTLARGQMGGNAYFQYDCVIYIFILGLMILVITQMPLPTKIWLLLERSRRCHLGSDGE